MNIEEWIKENAWRGHVDESALRELLKTHAIVPREPSKKQLDAMSCRLKALHGDNFPSPITTSSHIYKVGIEVAENE